MKKKKKKKKRSSGLLVISASIVADLIERNTLLAQELRMLKNKK